MLWWNLDESCCKWEVKQSSISPAFLLELSIAHILTPISLHAFSSTALNIAVFSSNFRFVSIIFQCKKKGHSIFVLKIINRVLEFKKQGAYYIVMRKHELKTRYKSVPSPITQTQRIVIESSPSSSSSSPPSAPTSL